MEMNNKSDKWNSAYDAERPTMNGRREEPTPHWLTLSDCKETS